MSTSGQNRVEELLLPPASRRRPLPVAWALALICTLVSLSTGAQLIPQQESTAPASSLPPAQGPTLPARTLLWTGAASTDWFNPANWRPAAVPGTADHLNVTGGTVHLPAPVTIGGRLTWFGGSLSGAALTIASHALLDIRGPLFLSAPLINAGTVRWTGAGNLQLRGSALVNLPGALFDLQNDQAINPFDGTEQFSNAGTLRKSAGFGASTFSLALANSGSVEVHNGILLLRRGGSLGGRFYAAAGAAILFAGGSFVLEKPPLSSGAGQVEFAGDCALSFTRPIQQFNLTGGHLNGTNLVSGTLNWTGGTVVGPLTIASNAVLNLAGPVSLSAPLTNYGTVNCLGAGNLQLYGSVIFNRPGALFDLQNDQAINQFYGTESFSNDGTLRKTAAFGATAFNVDFANSGTVEARSGMLLLNGGGSLGGRFHAAAGAAILFSGGTFVLETAPISSGAGQIERVDNTKPNYSMLGYQPSLVCDSGTPSNTVPQTTAPVSTPASLPAGEPRQTDIGGFAALGLGSTVVRSGEAGTLPIRLHASSLTSLRFVLDFPTDRFSHLSLQPLPAALASASLQAAGPDRVLVTLAPRPNQTLAGNQTVAELAFDVASDAPSAFVPMTPQALQVIHADGSEVANLAVASGRVVVVGEEPLLEALVAPGQDRCLALYGKPGASYQLQLANNLTAGGWRNLQRVPMRGLVEILSGPVANQDIAFYRAYEFMADPPVLEAGLAGQDPFLLVYGVPDSTCQLEVANNLCGQITWYPLLNFRLTNSFEFITGLPAPDPMVFYRVKQP